MNIVGVIHIVPKTSWTSMVGCVDCLASSFISCEVNKPLELEAIIVIIWKMTRSSWSMFSKTSLWFEDEMISSLLIFFFWGAWRRRLLKFEVKTRGRREERPLPYIAHMKILIYILVFNIIWALHCFALPMTMIKYFFVDVIILLQSILSFQ